MVCARRADPGLSVVGDGDRVDERESQAGAGAGSRAFALAEPFRGACEEVRVHLALVVDGEDRDVVVGGEPGGDRDGAVAVPYGVVDDVAQGSRKKLLVAPDDDLVGEIDVDASART